MKNLLILTIGLPLASLSNLAADQPATSLTVGEGFANPIGYHDATPRFSWKLPEGVTAQTAYRLEVRSGEKLWESGWVDSSQSVLVPYEGTPLASRSKVTWKVDYRDQDNEAAGWSEPETFELGLLSQADWEAHWIRPADEVPKVESTSWLRREFTAQSAIKSARLHVTARGLFEVHLNGQKVGNDEFGPGWTNYNKRIDTLTYDVTEQLKEGENALGVMLGTGWYAGEMGLGKNRTNQYGKNPELLLQLEITHEDGTISKVTSDKNWKATFEGPIRSSSIYNGEIYDARKELTGWSAAEFDDSSWQEVTANADLGPAMLSPKPFAPVRVTETVEVQEITEPTPGHFVFNMGQNMVGYPELNIPVEADGTVTVRFAELLSADGNIYTDNYRGAKSTNKYTAAKTGTIKYTPTFTFHGFQYIELTGLPEGAKPEKDWIKGLVLTTDLPQIGNFASSHEKLNQLQSNIIWGQRGNFLDIPTDCPQRDERLGWTGDAQVFCSTAMFNFDTHAFWKSWLGSMRDDQLEDGRIPSVVPNVFLGRVSPGWMDAATIIPWQVYIRTGDLEVLSENFEMMEKHLAFYRSLSEDHLIGEIKAYGDWLQPYAEKKEGDTPFPLLGTAFFAYSAQIIADSAALLGKEEEAERYRKEAAAIKEAFRAKYLAEDGKLQNSPETQTAYILALQFDLVSGEMQQKLAKHLERLLEEAGGHLRTGFLGTPYIAQVLDENGYDEEAFSLLFQETYPSWFYSINQGATTMWERWNSYTKEDGFHPEGMNSFNHYAYGAIGEWMYERVAGLAPDPENPGYKHILIRPLLGGPLTSASASLETPYGMASSAWTKEGDKLKMTLVIPPNTTATVEFPNEREAEKLGPGEHNFTLEL